MRLLLVALAGGASYAYAAAFARKPRSLTYQPITPSLNVSQTVQSDWAAYSPYVPLANYTAPPASCEITQVNILQRHGARYPTGSSGKLIKASVKKLAAATESTSSQLAFLQDYTYDLGKNDLVAFGAAQSYDAGQEAYTRYAHLISQDNLPFVRASSKERVVQSATNWTAGFAAASNNGLTPVLSVILSEKANDTLDDAMCTNVGSSDAQIAQWQAVYGPPITAQLNAWAPGADLSDADTANLISLCPFETVYHETPSPFCTLFESLDAFPGYGYSGDLDKYYGTGYGQALGRVQGVGYVNELLARLTNTSVQDTTQTNTTLDASPATFPLGRSMYADFSHDNQMVAIYAALGLFPQAAPLDPTRADVNRTWITSRMVPFAGRMVVERLDCAGAPHVRILVNQEVQPLQFCGGDSDGLCALDAFVQSQGYARGGGAGDWEKCFS
ncbi:histidine phosphatase superfamily [Amylocystis lapponica]|nr:histidine phosphatase superfamily [Amylocystis lapponica]